MGLYGPKIIVNPQNFSLAGMAQKKISIINNIIDL
jgi:hypothetical protein